MGAPEPSAGLAFEGPIGDGAELAPLAPSDADELFALVDANRDHLRPWMPWIDSTNAPADTLAFIQATIDQHERNDGFQCAIRRDGAIIGVIGHHGIDWPNRLTSLGYWIAADCEGKGIITRACVALIDFAFETLQLNRVEISTAFGNDRSLAVIKRLGLVEEGVRRQAEWVQGRYADLRTFAVLRSEWREAPRR